jgi:iron complex outermembrane receptor protein
VSNAALNGFEANSYSNPVTKSYAAFGQASWNISNTLSFTGGLRFTHEDKTGVYRQYWVAGTDLSTLPTAVAAAATALRNAFNPVTSYTTSIKDNSVSGLATLGWKVTPDALVYATYARGNKSGGLNLTNIPTGAVAAVKPEKVDNFEVGLKSQFLNRRVTANLAGFWTEVSDYQAAVTNINALGVGFQYISNIPKVRSRGVEADLAYAPTTWISVTASGSYADTVYVSYTNAPQAPENNATLAPNQNLSGVQLPGVPKFTYTIGADVAQPLRGGSTALYGHADFAHRSTFNTSSSNSHYAQVPGYGLLNARIGVRSDNGRWDVSVWARNLTNTNYYQALSVGTGSITGTIGDPRTYGVTLKSRL